MTLSASPSPPSRSRALGLVARLTLLIGGVAVALWLWTRLCEFPEQPWNDLRVAPSVALAQSLPVYPTAESGTVNTWTYGPLPLLVFLPSALASTAAGAMMIAAILNLLLTLVPLALVCFLWPAADSESDTRFARLAAFLLCLALWPERQFLVHSADTLAIACGLIGNLLLVRSRHALSLWFAAALAVAAVACKQTAVGLALAQVVWLAFTAGWRAAFVHALRCAALGAILAFACVLAFGGPPLWFVLFELPAHFKWAPDPAERILASGGELAGQVLAPLAFMLALRRFFRRPTALLPALAWMCALPLGLAAFLKFGGRMNSIYSFLLWLPPVTTLALTSRFTVSRHLSLPLAAAVGATAFFCVRVSTADPLTLRPRLGGYAEAATLAARLPGQVWFPLHPLVTLYSEGRYYHDEDGFYVRRMTHRMLTPGHAAAQLPARLRAIAFHRDWTDWSIARHLLPPHSREIPFGEWTVLTAPPAASP